MKKTLILFVFALISGGAFAAGGKGPIDVIVTPGRPSHPPGHGGGHDDGRDHDRDYGTIACVSVNQSSGIHYLAKGTGQGRVSAYALNRCLDNTRFASNCSNARCERESRYGREEAAVQNTSSRRMYNGYGATRLEARANAMNSCVRGTRFASNCRFLR